MTCSPESDRQRQGGHGQQVADRGLRVWRRPRRTVCDRTIACAMIDAAICRARMKSRIPSPSASPTRTSIAAGRKVPGRSARPSETAGATTEVKASASDSRTRCGHHLIAKGRHQEQRRADPQEDQQPPSRATPDRCRRTRTAGHKDRSCRDDTDHGRAAPPSRFLHRTAPARSGPWRPAPCAGSAAAGSRSPARDRCRPSAARFKRSAMALASRLN